MPYLGGHIMPVFTHGFVALIVTDVLEAESIRNQRLHNGVGLEIHIIIFLKKIFLLAYQMIIKS